MDTILLFIKNKNNRDLIKEWLRGRYSVFVDETEITPPEAVDLCIVDGPSLDEQCEWIRKVKSNQTLFFPVVLITSRKHVSLLTRQLWKSIDELILAPILKQEFQARVEILLRVRRLSEEVKRYIEMMKQNPLARLHLAISASNIGLWDWDLGSNHVFYSSDWKRQIGYEEGEIGEDIVEWRNRVHPDDANAFWNSIANFIKASGKDFRSESRLQHKDGSYKWMLTQASLLFDEQGRPWRMLGCHIDITGRKQAEEEFQFRHYLFTEAQRLTHLGSWDVDLPSMKTIWTDEMYRIFGVSPGSFETTLENFLNLIHPEDRAAMHEWIKRSSSGKETEELVFRVIRPDGTIRYIRGSGKPFFDEKGNPTRLIGTAQDITATKEAEKALRENEERLRLALKGARQGLYDLNTLTGKAVVSSEYAGILGYAPDEVKEIDVQWWLDRVHPDDLKSTYDTLNECIIGNQREYAIEYRLKKKNGEWVWVLSLGRVFEWDKQGQPLRMLGTHTDITPRKKIEENLKANLAELEQKNIELKQANSALDEANAKLREIDRLKTDFVSTASHEIRTPLTSILGFAQTLQDPDIARDEEIRQKYLHTIESEAFRLSKLADNLLDVSRMEAGHLKIGIVKFSVVQLIKEIVGSIILPQGLHVDILVDSKAEVTIRGDRDRIGVVVRNILDNAIRYSRTGSTIRMEVTRNESEMMVAIKDTGQGIPDKDLTNVFTEFFRVKGEMRSSKGSGLGLPMAKRIINAHGGRIWAESEPGHGSTLFFTLPLQRESSTDEPTKTGSTGPQTARSQ